MGGGGGRACEAMVKATSRCAPVLASFEGFEVLMAAVLRQW
jgi:hypothetical protein